MDIRGVEPEISPTELVKDIVLKALFKVTVDTYPKLWVHTNTNNSNGTTEVGDVARAIKREWT